MKTFNNLNKLFSHINKQIEKSMTGVGEEARKILSDYMEREWYNSYSPSNYERSWELLNSISVSSPKKISNTWQVEIYFDTTKIHPYSTPDGEWNKHMSLNGDTSYNGKSISEWLIEWIEYGQNSPIYSWDGVHMISYTKAELMFTKKHLNRIMDELQKQGIKARFR